MEDQLPVVSPHGKKRSATGIQVRAVHRGDVVRTFQQAGSEVNGLRRRRWMRHRLLTSIRVLGIGILAGMAAAVLPVAGQTPAPKKVAAKTVAPVKKPPTMRTPWGDPDLQGVWNDATST